jgi:hypothetical protein
MRIGIILVGIGIVLFGMVHHWRGLRKSQRIRRIIVDTNINHGAEILTRGRVRSEKLRLIANFLGLIVAGLAFFQSSRLQFTPAGVAAAIAILLMLTLQQAASVFDSRDDEELRHDVDHQIRQLGGGIE